MFLKNAKIWLGKYDLTADFNQISLSEAAEVLDDTRFGPVLAKAVVAGLRSAKAAGKCFWYANSPTTLGLDDILTAALAASEVPLTVANSNAGAVGERAYTLLARTASLTRAAQIGQQFMVDVAAESVGTPLVHGVVLHNGAESSGGNATAQNLGLLASGKIAYAALHITAISGGGTLTVKVQSDDGAGFPSATDRITFTAATVAGSEAKTLAGPVATDTYWRANWTLTAGTATFALILGFA